jgi:hypothetical protein
MQYTIAQEDAFDAYSDTILAAIPKIQNGSFEGRSSLSTWLYRIAANEALINGSPDCQRLALLSFFRARGQEEGLPVAHDVNNTASLAKLDLVAGTGFAPD